MFAKSTRTAAAVAVVAALATTGTAAAAEPQSVAAPQAPVLDGRQGTPVTPKGSFRKAVRKRSAKHNSMLKAGWIGPYCFYFNYTTHREALCQWEMIGSYGQWITYQEFYANYGSGWRYLRNQIRYF